MITRFLCRHEPQPPLFVLVVLAIASCAALEPAHAGTSAFYVPAWCCSSSASISALPRWRSRRPRLGYCGILTLGHAAFFALGGYCMGMYLMRQIGSRGVYGIRSCPTSWCS